jgi:hypothetical protein
MYKLSIALFGALVSLSGCSFAASDCGKTSVLSGTKEDGTKVELIIDSAALEKTPTWRPGQGDPPFSVAKAVEAGTAWAKDHYKRFDGVEVERISLHDFGCSGKHDHWFYIIEFAPVMDGSRMFSSFNWAAVLFDGTVIGTTESKHGSN